MAASHSLDLMGVAWRLGVTLLLVVLNGFFVAAEFALVTVRRARIVELAEEGRFTARMATHRYNTRKTRRDAGHLQRQLRRAPRFGSCDSRLHEIALDAAASGGLR